MGIKMLRLPGPGKNLFDIDQDISTERIATGKIWNRYTVAIDLSTGDWSTKHVTNVGAGTYIVSVYNSSGLTNFANVIVYDGTTTTKYSSGSAITITKPSEIWLFGASASVWTSTITKVQVEKGSTITEHEPYQEYLYYPGVTNENDSTDHGKVDMGTLSWIYQTDGTYPVFRATLDSPSIATGTPPILAFDYKIHNSIVTATYFKSNLLDKTIAYQSSSNVNQIMIQDSRFTTATALKAALSGKYLYYQRTTDANWNPPFWAFLQGGNE